MRKLFSITPFLILNVGYIIYAIYFCFFAILSDDSDGWELIIFLGIVMVIVLLTVVDIVLKLMIENKNYIIIGQFIIIALIGLRKILFS